MTWEQLTNEIGRRVYQIEMAEGMVPVIESGVRWDRYFESVKGKTHVHNFMDHTQRIVGTALIAMKERGLVDYEDK